ncbi:MAG: antitoxin family protein [Chloroflexota bacterium]|nr:antitoxin family protein [Chloroflexota bacterium]
MIKSVRARFRGGLFEPLDEVDLEEGAEVLLTLEDEVFQTEEEEDAAFARAITEGMKTPFMDSQEVLDILRDRDGD